MDDGYVEEYNKTVHNTLLYTNRRHKCIQTMHGLGKWMCKGQMLWITWYKLSIVLTIQTQHHYITVGKKHVFQHSTSFNALSTRLVTHFHTFSMGKDVYRLSKMPCIIRESQELLQETPFIIAVTGELYVKTSKNLKS